MWLIVSSLSPYNLHLLFYCIWFFFRLAHFNGCKPWFSSDAGIIQDLEGLLKAVIFFFLIISSYSSFLLFFYSFFFLFLLPIFATLIRPVYKFKRVKNYASFVIFSKAEKILTSHAENGRKFANFFFFFFFVFGLWDDFINCVSGKNFLKNFKNNDPRKCY